nr:DUF305 domain-containing protein [Flexivirga meconopsidis]
MSGLIGYRMGNSTPGDNSVEAGFARDMQTHHQQAVEMSFIIRDKTSDEAIRTLAYDIITSQQQQMGQMYGWLQVWGLPQTGSRPPMAWMAGGHGGMRMGGASSASPGSSNPETSSAMPGMATPAQLQQLRDVKGKAADRLFLQLMIRHHQGGLDMAQAVQGRTKVRAVTVLASAIETAQTAEIAQMKKMLADRPATT